MFVFCVDGHGLCWYNSTVIITKHYNSITSYNFGNRARAFLPSYRKWLDYEVIVNRAVKHFFHLPIHHDLNSQSLELW